MKKIFVWGLLYYLRFFAKVTLLINKPKVIGITGSVGKSSARNVVYAITKDYFSVKMIKEGNSETGVPLGILGINPGDYSIVSWLKIIMTAPFKIFNLKNIQLLIVEMGIDSPLPPKNMDYLLSIVRPDISVVLNVYPVHSENFNNIKQISEEKIKIITMVKPTIGIYNADNIYICEQLLGYKASKLHSFGKNINNNIYYGKYNIDLKKTSFELIIPEFRSKKINIDLKDYFLPKKYQETISAGFLVGQTLGLSIEEIIKGLTKNFFLPKGRSSVFVGIHDSKIIDSSYNSSRAPMLTFIENVGKVASKEKRPFVVLMGDMRELGRESESEHILIAKSLIENKVNNFYCVGELTKKYVLPEILKYTKEARWFESSKKLGEFLVSSLPYQSVVLVKGSQNTIFLEEAVKYILKNKEDEKKLCRQNAFWIKTKNAYFQGV